MVPIVAARFDTFDEAQAVAARMQAEGYAAEQMSTFFVNQPGAHDEHPLGGDRTNDPAATKSPYGAVAGVVVIGLVGLFVGIAARAATGAGWWVLLLTTGIGAYVGSLLGALIATRRRRPAREPGRPTGRRQAGVMLAIKADDARALDDVVRTLHAAGGKDIEEAQGEWREGQWVDFDPVHSPVLTKRLPATAH
ncbi:hypothetical protein FOZ76_03550 [Verticiella sediminum]|uniref:Glycine zipper family protein n=1 Tax=Verticiella sediminum TaxID=1247510 RepID=A0A556AY70_9BURK|nr:hypothetical protein [Verticiella sediminum]TSH97879.1 hypothetical protein FOZ76_03550 [Verticiella sediminum]